MSDPELTRTAATSQGPAEPTARRRIGRYTVEKSVGEGGMGVVYAAHDPDLDRRVAVKVLRSASHASPEQRARLLREARAMARLTHRNVVTVHEVGTDGDIDFVAMELLEGGSLGELHRAAHARGTLSRPEVLAQFREAGLGLAAAHAAGLVHRDFKPHNVLVASDGRVVVTDFGLARAVGDAAGTARRSGPVTAARSDQALDETLDAGASGNTGTHTSPAGGPPGFSEVLTRTGSMVGTPAYMPPEQFAGEAGDPRADQFAFCVALWESLCGKRPFVGNSIDALWSAVAAGVPSSAGKALPRGLRRVLVRGLDPDPARRWPSMDALLTAIDRSGRGGRVVRGFAIALGIPAALSLVAFLTGPHHPPPPTCALPPSAIDAAWSPARRAALPADVAAVVAPLFDRARAGWLTAQHAACAAPAPRAAALACLDEAGQALGALVDAAARSTPARARAADLAGLVPDVEACRSSSPVAVAAPRSAAAAAARRAIRRDADALLMALRAADVAPAPAMSEVTRLRAAAAAAGDDVARAEVAYLDGVVAQARGALDDARHAFEEAALAAEAGGHGLVYAEVAIARYDDGVSHNADPDEKRVLRERAAATVARAGGSAALAAELDLVDADAARRADRRDDAITAAEHAFTAQRAVGASIGMARAARALIQGLLTRSGPGDAERAREVCATALAVARAALGDDHAEVLQLATAQNQLTWDRDPVAAAAIADAIRPGLDRFMIGAKAWLPPVATRAVTGIVRLPDGRPAAGAEVAVALGVLADVAGLDPMLLSFEDPQRRVHAWADGDGRFRVDVAGPAVAVAAVGDLRSAPVPVGAAPLTLTLGPTGVVRGAVRFESPRPPMLLALVYQRQAGRTSFASIGAIASDGSFEVPRVPPGHYQVMVQPRYVQVASVVGVDVEVTAGPAGPPATLVWRAGRLGLEVVVRGDRSASVPYANVAIVDRALRVHTLGELRAATRDSKAMRSGWADKVARGAEAPRQQGDLSIRFPGLAPGPITVCVVPLSGDPDDAEFSALMYTHEEDLDVVCQRHVLTETPTDQLIVIETPPMKRFAR